VSEFTGERVVAGEVEDSLWAEHMARYAFAATMAAGKRVLDIGCGTGYGTAELARLATEAVGSDVDVAAIAHAREHFKTAHFVEAPALDLPFSDASFDVITSFELIEHLEDAAPLLEEVRRVLHPAGVFLVSTPNKPRYAEARGDAGPNPFHLHEFDYRDYCETLGRFFPCVVIWKQDQVEAIAIHNVAGRADARIAKAERDPERADFFLALCSFEPVPEPTNFVYVPRATNLLEERRTHIQKLQAELQQVRGWLDETTASRNQLMERQRTMQEAAEGVVTQLTAAQNRIVELQDAYAQQERAAQASLDQLQAAAEQQKQQAQASIDTLQAAFSAHQAEAQTLLDTLNAETRKHAEWAFDLQKQLTERSDEVERSERLRLFAETTLAERNRELERLRAQLNGVRQSRWVRAGNKIGMGPELGE
jgi:ubiquinone/menaquinone biosynthesis C-methylase UbiE